MRALTLTQPWATLVALGEKRIETRSWRTDYRGPIAIHAAKGFPGWARETCWEPPFADVLTRFAYLGPGAGASSSVNLPTGVVLATATVLNVLPTTDRDVRWLLESHPHEEAFGDFGEGRWAWILGGVKRLDRPVPARGALGLWEWRLP